MKYIEKPKPLESGGEKFGVDELVLYLLNTDDQFNRDGAGVRSAVKIEAAVKAATGDAPIALEDTDQQRLAQAAEKPSNGYPVMPSRRLQPHIDAIAKAPSEPPKEQEKGT